MEPTAGEREWGFIRVRADSEEQMNYYLGRLWEIVECTGGYVGMFDEDDPPGELEVDLCSYRASPEELQQIWQRVQAGEEVMFAWRAVQGPSYDPRRYQTKMMVIFSRLRPPQPPR